MRQLVLLVQITVLVLAMCGCQRPLVFESLPPVAMLSPMEGSGSGGARTTGLGQGVWVGDRVLTAAHNIWSSEGGWISEVMMHGGASGGSERLRIRSLRTGAPDLDAERLVELKGVQHDWAAFEVDAKGPRGTRMLVADPIVRPGDELIVAGWELEEAGRTESTATLRMWRATAVRVVRERNVPFELPEGVFAISIRVEGEIGPREGWSGAMVGRFDREEGLLSYIGQFVAMDTPEGRRILWCVRPPDDVIEWLMEHADWDWDRRSVSRP